MHRFVLALLLLAPATAPVLAQSASQRANQQLQRDAGRDRLADAARDLETGGRPAAPALVDDMNRNRGSLAPERRDSPAVASPRDPSEAPIPTLGDNVQR